MAGYDVVIVGGAAMGSATAYWLTHYDPSIQVAVLDRDLTYEKSSTLRSDGNVRIQFNLEENIRISQFAMEFLATFAKTMQVGSWQPDPGVRGQGNLFLVDAEGVADARAGLDAQQRLGCNVRWMSAADIAATYPAFAGAEYVAGTLGSDDGAVDPAGVLEGYRRKAAGQGASYRQADVASLLADSGRLQGVALADGEEITAPVVVNAAGAWCRRLAATAGVQLPVVPVMRSVYVLEADVPSAGLPSVFAPSGLYVLPEPGDTFLVSWSLPTDPQGYDFTVRREHFDDVVWPELVRNFSAFDAVRVVRTWAGLYAVNTLDGNAIIGEWPNLPGFYLANGFTGHGFQQCHAVGRHLAELILGQEPSLDLSRLGPERIITGDPVPEHAGRLI